MDITPLKHYIRRCIYLVNLNIPKSAVSYFFNFEKEYGKVVFQIEGVTYSRTL